MISEIRIHRTTIADRSHRHTSMRGPCIEPDRLHPFHFIKNIQPGTAQHIQFTHTHKKYSPYFICLIISLFLMSEYTSNQQNKTIGIEIPINYLYYTFIYISFALGSKFPFGGFQLSVICLCISRWLQILYQILHPS